MTRKSFVKLLCFILLGSHCTATVRVGVGQDYFVPNVQDTEPPAEDSQKLHPNISQIQDVEAKLKVIQRRSQLIIGKSNISRTAVADPQVLDVVQFSPNEISVIGLGIGSTTVTFWFEGDSDPLVYLIEVIRDPSLEDRLRADYGKLERKIALAFPNSKVYLIPLSTKIIVKGQARDQEEAANILNIVRGEVLNQNGSLVGPNANVVGGFGAGGSLGGGGVGGGGALNGQLFNNGFDLNSGLIVNMLEVPGEFQIQMRVRVAELKREMLRRMGVNFQALLPNTAIQSLLGGGGSTVSGTFENGDVNVLINALAANGTAKILAEPNITVLSGHQAQFLAGGEFPVPTIVGVGGAAGQQTSFRGFGVSLFVTPTVMNKDIIRMQIQPEFSQINSQNGANGVPGTNVRRVSTTVEMREGQTVALAGLLDHQTRTEVARVPFLGEIPYLGVLFNTKQASEDETELLILVTPELVRPMDAEEVPPVPGHEVTPPNDYDLYWYNRTEGTPDQAVYQLAPYGNSGGHGAEVGYTHFTAAPSQPNYHPGPSGQPQGPWQPGAAQTPFQQGQPGQPYQTYPYGNNGTANYGSTMPGQGGRYSNVPTARPPTPTAVRPPVGRQAQVQPGPNAGRQAYGQVTPTNFRRAANQRR